MNNKPSTSLRFENHHKSKFSYWGSGFFSLSWLLVVTLLQAIATVILVGVFFIPYDIRLMSSCILSFTQMGFGQYDLIQLGLLIAGPIYLCVLCLEALFHNQSANLYAILLFEFWIIIFSSIQAYQHPFFIQEISACHTSDQNNTSIINSSNDISMTLPYGIIGTSCIGFLSLLIISIYHRKSFHQSMDSLHGALMSLLKLDSFLLFAYVIEIMPVPIMTFSSSITIAEIVLLFSFGFILFLLSWSTVLATWQTLPEWRVALHMVLLGFLCLICIGYLCYRLIEFALDTNPFLLLTRYSLIFGCLALMITLLLTTSLVMTFATRQWKLRNHRQPQEQESEKKMNHNEANDSELFLTPQNSRLA
ncbi:unnamed protein product [Cunninghamella blakesleeana]